MLKAYIFIMGLHFQTCQPDIVSETSHPGLYHSWGVNTPPPYLHTIQTPVLNVCHSVLNPCHKTAYVLFFFNWHSLKIQRYKKSNFFCPAKAKPYKYYKYITPGLTTRRNGLQDPMVTPAVQPHA